MMAKGIHEFERILQIVVINDIIVLVMYTLTRVPARRHKPLNLTDEISHNLHAVLTTSHFALVALVTPWVVHIPALLTRPATVHVGYWPTTSAPHIVQDRMMAKGIHEFERILQIVIIVIIIIIVMLGIINLGLIFVGSFFDLGRLRAVRGTGTQRVTAGRG
jgi:hypothetical protein